VQSGIVGSSGMARSVTGKVVMKVLMNFHNECQEIFALMLKQPLVAPISMRRGGGAATAVLKLLSCSSPLPPEASLTTIKKKIVNEAPGRRCMPIDQTCLFSLLIPWFLFLGTSTLQTL